MKLAIHSSPWGFSQDWIDYARQKNISVKIVDCHRSDIINQIEDCDVLLWHHHHSQVPDVLFAKQLLFAVEQAGKKVFPDFATGWHFDDKLGQKYLLESIKAPIVPTYAFYTKDMALTWAKETSFPKVFKLRGGAGSSNVKLIRSRGEAVRMIKKAFNSGFESYDRFANVKEHWNKLRAGKSSSKKLLKSIARVFASTNFAKTVGNQKGYVLFQDFVPDNTFDIRIVTIGNKAFGLKRMVRKGDFRASGSGLLHYDKEMIDLRTVQIAFETSKKLKAGCVAYDFVFDQNGNPLIVEINYAFSHKAYFKCPGYWNSKLEWIPGAFNAAHLIIDELINDLK